MGFNNANRFGYHITLPFGDHSYRINSPSVEVGNFVVESTQLAAQRATLTVELISLLEEQEKAGEDVSSETTARIEEIRKEVAQLTADLTVPDDLETDYFRSILGPAYDEMISNKEPFELVKLAASTVSVWVLHGRDDAEEFWNNGGRPGNRRAPQDRKAKRGRKPGTSK